ncbi:MAG: chorismate-binding protein [Propionibacteriaceae bacterium]|nr:chorismate-binding protein [Propionibacteriaceae bacterium]
MHTVSTTPLAAPLDLIACLDPAQAVTCWVRHGQGAIGVGRALGGTFGSAAEAGAWWRDMVAGVDVRVTADLVDEPLAGPVAFVSFPFAPTGPYEVVVPSVVVGQRGGRAWVTTWDDATWDGPRVVATEPPGVRFTTGSLGRADWTGAVRTALTRIRAGELDKVVLARDEVGEAAGHIDIQAVLARLAAAYPQTWTFGVQGLVGASPELLVRQDRGLITSRVLAGTIHGSEVAVDLAAALSSSSKDLAEHEYAVASVADALRGHVSSLHVPEVPFVLQLPNVMHLATDITGAARPGATVLELAAAIHPSAAVCGTPTEHARALITELEHLDRGRYAGPVGWINTHGDGEIALALRCGLIEGRGARIFAGCGIVADSDPESEWAETEAKLLPMIEALGATA